MKTRSHGRGSVAGGCQFRKRSFAADNLIIRARKFWVRLLTALTIERHAEPRLTHRTWIKRSRRDVALLWRCKHCPMDPAIEDVAGQQTRGRAVADVNMDHGPGAPRLHRQTGLDPIEGLDRRFLVDRE